MNSICWGFISRQKQYLLVGAVRADVTLQDPSGLSPALIRATKAPAVADPPADLPVPSNVCQAPSALGMSQLTPSHNPVQYQPTAAALPESNQVPATLLQQGLRSSTVHANTASCYNTVLCSVAFEASEQHRPYQLDFMTATNTQIMPLVVGYV